MPTTVQRDEIFTHAQPLRAHAFLLVGDRAMADDFAEETLRTAWRDFASVPPSGNLRAGQFTILGTVLSSSPIAELSGPAMAEGSGPGELLVSPICLQYLAEFRRALAALPMIE